MSRVVIIGGTGHVGTYLVPRLVSAGFEVVSVSRGQRAPYQPNGAWKLVRTVTLSRDAEEEVGAFGRKIRELRPDIVIDMICFTEASARHLVEALRGQVRHFLHTGTIWVHGPSVEVPTTEMQPRRPFGEYGIGKAQIEAYLIETAREGIVSGDHHPSRSYRRAGLGAAEPRRALQPTRLHHAGQGRRALHCPISASRRFIMCTPTTSPRCSCARSLTGAHRWGRPSTRSRQPRSRFGAMPRRWRAWFGREPEVALSALAGMEERAERAGGSADLRSHRAQPQLQYRQGGAHARLSAALSVDRGGVQISELADREGDRSGRTPSGLTPGDDRRGDRCRGHDEWGAAMRRTGRGIG